MLVLMIRITIRIYAFLSERSSLRVSVVVRILRKFVVSESFKDALVML